jgi:hypothetical protein
MYGRAFGHHGNSSSVNSLPIKTSDNPVDKVSN